MNISIAYIWACGVPAGGTGCGPILASPGLRGNMSPKNAHPWIQGKATFIRLHNRAQRMSLFPSQPLSSPFSPLLYGPTSALDWPPCFRWAVLLRVNP